MPSSPDGLIPADRQLLAALRLHDQGLRALLCTLARHGVALRLAAPARAQAWLDLLASHPYVKGGQFLFDLLEWEDFMLDGEAPPLVDTRAVRQALARVAQALRALSASLDGAAGAMELAVGDGGDFAPVDLPALEPGFYLFNDVLLGSVALAAGGVQE